MFPKVEQSQPPSGLQFHGEEVDFEELEADDIKRSKNHIFAISYQKDHASVEETLPNQIIW